MAFGKKRSGKLGPKGAAEDPLCSVRRPPSHGHRLHHPPENRRGVGCLAFFWRALGALTFSVYVETTIRSLSVGLLGGVQKSAKVEYLSTYNNIGSASCQIEDLSGRIISPVSRLNGLWDKHMSMSSQATFFANMTQLARDSKGIAAFRCRSEGKKFKILSISSC